MPLLLLLLLLLLLAPGRPTCCCPNAVVAAAAGRAKEQHAEDLAIVDVIHRISASTRGCDLNDFGVVWALRAFIY